MHPLCCSSPIPISQAAAAAAAAPMPPPAAAAGATTSSSLNHHHNGFRPSPPSDGDHGRRHHSNSNNNNNNQKSSSPAAVGEGLGASASVREATDVRINDIVGNGIAGVLHKWVNYGKGWRPRWFALQDGVLSYYKIHGPDRIAVNLETERGSKVIGDESMRRISRRRSGKNPNPNHPRRPVGEVHLKARIRGYIISGSNSVDFCLKIES